ncbi:YdhK family protein [Paenibacillus sp. NFR01]|uniref:YdhK family protein n=1 Tax=Paenibacillus sp. NFR01 TaxID=1566279 RepID=UPI0008D01D94|nr:YdhK family protein [Paenibacillus sp. NFR01]SES91574.1 Protein of unknown function [Paenibacillus sp. NFR01]
MKTIKLLLPLAAIVLLSIIATACASSGADKGDTSGRVGSVASAAEAANEAAPATRPPGPAPAEHPEFAVGSRAYLTAEHVPGMKGALATIASAYDTVVYSVSYLPSGGGKRITDHKWIIQEEIKGAGKAVYEPGAEVTLLADHMTGMRGVTAIIDSAERTTVYMVNYTPVNGGKRVHDYKWVTESELSAE